MVRCAVVLLAAGSGSRVGAASNKVLLPLGGEPVLAHSLRAARSLAGVERLLVVCRPDERDAVLAMSGSQQGARSGSRHQATGSLELVDGGPTRHGSEWAALQRLAPEIDAGRIDLVAIHDAARPLADRTLWAAVLDAALREGGALPVRPQPGLLARDGTTPQHRTTPTSRPVAVQTPQAFRAAPLLAAYRSAEANGFDGTDTAACVARYTDLRVVGVPAPATNLKITFADDLVVAEGLLQRLEQR